jgi:hypothetical protein
LLIWILLPEVAIDNPSHNRRLLRTSYSLLLLIAAGTILAEFALRPYLTRLLLGNAFSGQGTILILASLFQLLLVGATLYAFYLLVLRRRRALLLAVCIFLPTVVTPALFKPSSTYMMIAALLLGLLLGWAIYGIINGVRGALSNASEKSIN